MGTRQRLLRTRAASLAASTRVLRRVSGLSLLVACLGGCHGPRRSAEELVFAVRALRDAPNPIKDRYLRALRDQSCDTDALCEFKTQCVKAYELHLDATRRIQAVDDASEALRPGAEGATNDDQRKRSFSSLETATDLLETAHQLAHDCLQRETVISLDFRL